MKILVKQTFLHGSERFEAGDLRTVPDAIGAEFVANGWAEDSAGRVATGDSSDASVMLAINSADHSSGDSNG